MAELATYQATIVPWTWLLTRTSHCRSYQEKTRPDIVQEVLKEHGSDLELALSDSYSPQEFVVQYRETNHNFVNRLLEHEGITYFFKHTDAKHSIVLADGPAAYEPFEGFEKIRFSSEGFDRADEQQSIRTLSVTRVVTPSHVELNDFDPLVPGKGLKSRAEGKWNGTAIGRIYDYPGDYVAPADGMTYAKRRLEELQTSRHVISGTGNVRGIAVGHTFEIESPPRADLGGKKWLVVSASYQITVDDYGASAGAGGGSSFSVSFSAIESTVVFRPERTTPSPIISGPQTAFVVGRSGEEITVDKHGRVKVLFHWDELGKADETASCWVRVSQAWAGNGWGSIFTPRIGQEVIVEFLEGDPDKPIITGRVYNGRNRTPYALPDNMTISGVKSNSSKGGAGFNEIRFEDKHDSELLYIQAQKDLNTRVLNDSALFVGQDEHATVKRDRIEVIERDQSTTIKRDHIVEVTKDESVVIKGAEKREVTGKQSITVKDDVAIKNNKNCAIEVTEQFHIKAKEIILEASANLTIKVGSTTIAIEPGGVAIDAKGDVTVKTTGNCKVEASQSVELKGTAGFKAEGAEASVTGKAKAALESTGQTVVKGTMVMIN
jgi:type VI secretion system secreted protein VgrG